MKTEQHSFDADIKRVLHIVTHSLYQNKDIFIRELVSNAVDACDKLRYESSMDDNLMSNSDRDLSIRIEVKKDDKQIIISDNGIGMAKDELIANLGTIAKSGTRHFAEMAKEKGDSSLPELIGQFGVGFYSAFMVAEVVQVKSRRAGSDEVWLWTSSGSGDFVIEKCEDIADVERGTVIVLKMQDEVDEKYLDTFHIQHVVKTYCNHAGFPIEFLNDKSEWEKCNEGTSLWLKKPSEVTEEEYNEMFRTVSSTVAGDPAIVLHNHNEGVVEYINLLYIPSSKPFDLYNPEMRSSVKLYCNQVFITESNVDIIPRYFRFVKGIIDSPEVPLNISRETLQDNHQMRKISNDVCKRLLKGLKNCATKEPEKYKKFWDNFGEVFKEGLCTPLDSDMREKMLALTRFETSEQPVGTFGTLDEYLEKMKDEQEFIYYCIGDKRMSARMSSQLHAFTARGIEVLIMDDPVDAYWTVAGAMEYKGKKFQSITTSDVDLEKFDIVDEEVKKQQDEVKDYSENDINDFVKHAEDLLKGRVENVRVSKKLTTDPVCLAAAYGAGMDMKLQQLLVEEKQMQSVMLKSLEINIKHPIIEKLLDMFLNDKDNEMLAKSLKMLVNCACVTEKEPLSDPKEFMQESHKMLMKILG